MIEFEKKNHISHDQPDITIIVPVYMAATHLHRCVDSLLAQTVENIELILIDDGSPDESGSLCDSFSERDSRIRVIHKDNGGPSDARNAGLDVATGRYIGFVDSDDYVDPDMFEYLYFLADKYDADIAGCRIRDVCVNSPSKHSAGKSERKIETEKITLLEGIDSVRYVLEWGTDMYAFNKIYRRKLFDDLRFRKGRLFEDAWLMVDIFSKTEKTVFSTMSKYNHCHREDSITAASYDSRFRDVIAAHDYNYIRATELSPDLEAAADIRRCWARFYLMDKMLLSGYKNQTEIDELLRFLKARKHNIFASKQFGVPRKIALSALLLNRRLYYPFVLGQNVIERRK